jgi:hypothetical protein
VWAQNSIKRSALAQKKSCVGLAQTCQVGPELVQQSWAKKSFKARNDIGQNSATVMGLAHYKATGYMGLV